MDERILYSFPFFLASILIFTVAFFTLRRIKAPGAWYLVFACLSATIWSATEGMLYLGSSFTTNILITKFQYFGITPLPPMALLFGLAVFGHEDLITKKLNIILFLLAVTIIIIVWTNPLHKLLFSDYYIIDQGPLQNSNQKIMI